MMTLAAPVSMPQRPYLHLAPTTGAICARTHQHFTRQRRWSFNGLVAALALAFLPVVPTYAQTLTATQSVDVSGEYLPPCATPCNDFPEPMPIVYSPYSGSSLGDSSHDFSSVQGIDEGTASWEASIDSQGFVRTASDLAIKNSFGEAGQPDFNNLKVEVNSTVKYSDTIELASGEGPLKKIVFQTRLTGKLLNNVIYSNPSDDGAFAATYESTAKFSGKIEGTGLLNPNVIEPFDVGETSSILGTPGLFNENVDESDDLFVAITFDSIIYQLSAGTVEFEWEYSDSFLVDIEGIDAGSIDIYMQNDLRNTAVTTASVFDLEGNLLPDERVVSSVSGYEYALNPVPIPAAAWLFGSALLGLAAVKRKKA